MRAGPKQPYIASALLIIAVAVGLTAYVGWYLPNRHNQDWSDYVRSLPITNDAAAAEDIPVYPGAEHAEGHTSLSTRANPADVLAFYKAALSRKGWVLSRELDEQRGLHFVWVAGDETAPYDLNIDFRRQTVDRYTRLDWVLQRVPVLERVPLFPNARQASVENRKSHYVDIERVTTYFAQAKLGEVEQYYRNELPRHGWGLQDYSKTNFSLQLTFNYSVGAVSDLVAGEVTITAEPEPGGLTQVELHARGYNYER